MDGDRPAAESGNESNLSALQEVIGNEVRQLVEDVLVTITETFEERIEQLLCFATVCAKFRISAVLYGIVEHNIFDQIRTAVLGQTIDIHNLGIWRWGAPLTPLKAGYFSATTYLPR